jgi:hypothetical protein
LTLKWAIVTYIKVKLHFLHLDSTRIGNAMQILLNSDVLRSVGIGLKSPQEISNSFLEFLQVATENGIAIKVPETATLELSRYIDEVIIGRRNKIINAANRLKNYGVMIPSIDEKALIPSVSMDELLESYGMEIEHVCSADYEEAHRRACLHIAPAPTGDSDEMRDLIIWMMSIRIAKSQTNGAILISNDNVHHDSRVENEARAVNLVRFREYGDALDHLGELTSEIKFLQEVFTTAWPDLIKIGMPISGATRIIKIKPKIFWWPKDLEALYARADIKLSTVEDGITIEMSAFIRLQLDGIVKLTLTNIRRNGELWHNEEIELSVKISVAAQFPAPDDFAERRRFLMKLIE